MKVLLHIYFNFYYVTIGKKAEFEIEVMIVKHYGVSSAVTFSDFAARNFEVLSDHKTYGNEKKIGFFHF